MAFENFFAGLRGPEDPQAIDPTYGVPAGDVHAARLASLQRMGMLLTAAGSTSGNARAQILAQMGDAMDPSKTLYTQAQARLMNSQAQETERKRRAREETLAKLRGQDISSFATPREQELFRLYIEAGDPDGALDVLARARASAETPIMMADGSTVTKGVGLRNREHFNKTYAPVLDDLSDKVHLGVEALNAIESGLFAGSLGEQKLAAAKLLEAFGVDTGMRDKILNSETVAASTMDLVLARMAQLGGNDSNEELRRMQASLAGGYLEPETLKRNMQRVLKTAIEEGARANEQFRRLSVNGQADYGGYVKFDPAMIPDEQFRSIYERVTGSGKTPAASGQPATTTSEPAMPQTQEDFDALPKGSLYIDPDDGQLYRK